MCGHKQTMTIFHVTLVGCIKINPDKIPVGTKYRWFSLSDLDNSSVAPWCQGVGAVSVFGVLILTMTEMPLISVEDKEVGFNGNQR